MKARMSIMMKKKELKIKNRRQLIAITKKQTKVLTNTTMKRRQAKPTL